MSSNQSGEGEIRKKMIEADLVDCMIALPTQLFYGAAIPACLWFLTRSKKNGKFKNRQGHTLFIDCRKMGHLVDRTHRDLMDEEIERIAKTYHAIGWKVNGAGGEGGSLTILCGAQSEEKRAMIQAIEAENPLFKHIPTYLSRFGLRVWKQDLENHHQT